MQAICQISGKPGEDLVVKNSRLLPKKELIVDKCWWDKGYEPRSVVVMYGRLLYSRNLLRDDASNKVFNKIIAGHLYFGKDITYAEILL